LPPVAAEEPLRVPEPALRLSCCTAEPEERVLLPEVERVALLLPEERVALPLLRLALPLVLPEERVELLLPEDRVALLPVLRLRLSCWAEPVERDAPEEEPEERVAELPEDLVALLPEDRVALPPLLRLRLSCWAAVAEDRDAPEEDPEARVALLPEEPEERVAELPEELREEDEVLWEERVLLPLLPRERLWASISGAVSMAMAITREAANVINLFIASEF
jgi:hypothetical protein